MPLPILAARNEPSPADLLRLFHQTENRWCEHLAEPHPLDVGTAFANPALPRIYIANQLRDAALPEDMSPQQAMQLVDDHFRAQGVRCAQWSINPSAPRERTGPLVDLLEHLGWQPRHSTIMLLQRIQPVQVNLPPGLRIIPARASFRHARILADEHAAAWGEPQLADARLAHLDDPHWDCLLALQDGTPIATAGVLAMGEIGRIDQVYVAQAHRRRGLGLIMMARVLEICARSLFRHIMLAVRPDNDAAIHLYRRLGFEQIGQLTSHLAPELARG